MYNTTSSPSMGATSSTFVRDNMNSVPQVPLMLSRMSEVLGRLDDRLNELQARLIPAMRQMQEPSNSRPGPIVQNEPRAPLASNLFEYSEKALNMCQRVEYMLENLEI